MAVNTPFSQEELIPQEEKLDIKKHRDQLFIGLPKEDFNTEYRICLTPEAVAMLTANGHRVLMESDAGKMASYTDKEYSEAGAEITHDTEKVFACPIVIKVQPPTIQEIEWMKPGSYLFSALQFKTQTAEYFTTLSKKKITALSYECVQDEEGSCPFLNAMSEIAGVASIHIASEYMNKYKKGKGLLFGNITGVLPTEVVIIGAGTVAEYSARTALAFGASVKVFDNSIHRLKRIQKLLPQPISTSTIQEKVLKKALRRCDVVIGAIRGINRSPIVITEDMVQIMKANAVIIDVCIDNGGCVETSELTSHQKPVLRKHGVIHYCVPNISSRYSKTSSQAISNILSTYLMNIGEYGGIEDYIGRVKTIRSGIYLYKGILVSRQAGEWCGLDNKDINLLLL